MSNVVVKKYDELLRCTNVLTDGAEDEFHKFATHQEKCRRRWHTAEEENHETKKNMAKYKADHDTLEVKLKMARHQLDTEMRKRLKAEQSVEHMAQRLNLLKELLLEKDADPQALIHTIYQHGNIESGLPGHSVHESYTDESSINLPDSEYDNTEDYILDDTGDILDNGKTGKRLSQLNNPASTQEHEDVEYGKRTRFSAEITGYFV